MEFFSNLKKIFLQFPGMKEFSPNVEMEYSPESWIEMIGESPEKVSHRILIIPSRDSFRILKMNSLQNGILLQSRKGIIYESRPESLFESWKKNSLQILNSFRIPLRFFYEPWKGFFSYPEKAFFSNPEKRFFSNSQKNYFSNPEKEILFEYESLEQVVL